MIGPLILLCVAGLFGYLGSFFLAAVFCAADAVALVGVCIAVIVGSYVYMWAEDVGLLPVIGLAVSFLSLMGTLAALFNGLGGGTALGFCLLLVTLFSSIRAVKKTKIKRSGGGWVEDVVGAYFFLCGGTLILGSVCMTVAVLLFGLDVNFFSLEVITTEAFPFVGLECCQSANDGLPP